MSNHRSALDGLRVLQIGAGEAPSIAGMVLAENGAEVIMVEPPAGSSDRQRPGHVVWNRGKKSAVIDLTTKTGRDHLYAAARTVDAAIVGLRPASRNRLGIDAMTLRAAAPQLIYVELNGFGSIGGPERINELPAYEGIVAAVTGRMASTNGYREGPIFTPVPIAGYGTAMLAVSALLAGVYSRRYTGRGQTVGTDMVRALSAFDMTSGIGNRVHTPAAKGMVYAVMRVPFMTAPTKDNRFLQMCARQRHHFRNWVNAMNLGKLLEDTSLPYIPDLFPSEKRLLAVIDQIKTKMRERTRDEWMHIFSRDDIGGDPFLTASEYLEHPQNTENNRSKTVYDLAVGNTRQIGPLALLSDTPTRIESSAPRLGAHTAELVAATPLAIAATTSAPPRRPLEGVTVLECGYFYATPFSSTLLAELGAKVWKVEPNEGDPGRRNWTTDYVKAMVEKESVVLDLKKPEGLAAMHALVDKADVFIHNFRPGTPARLKIDYDTLIARNPRLVYIYGSCFGSNGPWARKAGFHSSPNAISGAGIIEAGQGNNPINRTYADPASAVATAAAALVGLEARERTGRGQYIETVMLTSMAYAVSEWGVTWNGKRDRVVDAGMQGFHALHRLYPTADGWLYLEIHKHAEWKALCRSLGRDDLTDAERFKPFFAPWVAIDDSNRAANDELSELLGGLFAQHAAADWVRALRIGGVPVVRADGISHDDFMLRSDYARENGVAVLAAQEGMDQYWRAGPAFELSERRVPIAPSDPLGNHTEAVLRSIGYTDAQLAALAAKGVTTPTGNELPD